MREDGNLMYKASLWCRACYSCKLGAERRSEAGSPSKLVPVPSPCCARRFLCDGALRTAPLQALAALFRLLSNVLTNATLPSILARSRAVLAAPMSVAAPGPHQSPSPTTHRRGSLRDRWPYTRTPPPPPPTPSITRVASALQHPRPQHTPSTAHFAPHPH